MEIPTEGKYVCKLNGPVVIYEASTGSLCGAVPCVMVDSGFTFKHTLVLVKSDGTVMTRTTDTLRSVFGWDGRDPFWLMDESEDGGALRALEFVIVGGPETSEKGGQYFKSQWLNPMGSGAKTPVSADRAAVLAKYGSKFQSLAAMGSLASPSGAHESKGRPSGPSLPANPNGAHGVTRPTNPSGRPSGPSLPTMPPMVALTQSAATMEEAWAALNAAHSGLEPAALEKLWYATISRLFPSKSNTELRAHEWGQLKAEFSRDEIPFL